jgi:hypothetical protein
MSRYNRLDDYVVAVLAERGDWFECFMIGVCTWVLQTRGKHFKGHTSLDWVTLDDLEELA